MNGKEPLETRNKICTYVDWNDAYKIDEIYNFTESQIASSNLGKLKKFSPKVTKNTFELVGGVFNEIIYKLFPKYKQRLIKIDRIRNIAKIRENRLANIVSNI